MKSEIDYNFDPKHIRIMDIYIYRIYIGYILTLSIHQPHWRHNGSHLAVEVDELRAQIREQQRKLDEPDSNEGHLEIEVQPLTARTQIFTKPY